MSAARRSSSLTANLTSVLSAVGNQLFSRDIGVCPFSDDHFNQPQSKPIQAQQRREARL